MWRSRVRAPHKGLDVRVHNLCAHCEDYTTCKLHRELKHAAVDRDTSLNELVLAALEEWWKAQPEGVRT
jgi:hypothetical protein